MKRIYNVGQDQNQISIDVNVHTPGVASSIVQQRWSGGQFAELGASKDSSGDIAKSIGTGLSLRNSYVVVYTYISLEHIDDNIENILNNTRVNYEFSGGLSGIQLYHLDSDDIIINSDKKSALAIKPFKMS